MRKFTKALGFIMFILLVLEAIPSVSHAAEQQYTENLIPAMMSDSSPSGIVSADRTSIGYSNFWAFDQKLQDGWSTDYATGWLAYEFSTPQIISKYTLQMYARPTNPKNWTFEAWDGTNWVVLDTRNNIICNEVKKLEFTFDNKISYKKYRMNVSSSSNGGSIMIAEIEMMSLITPQVSGPTNLTAKAGDTIVNLSWNAVVGVTSYNVKRSTTSGGPYDTVAMVTGSDITFTNTGLTNGITYYYVVTAVNSNGESGNSNEASATPIAASDPSTITGNKAILVISFDNGKEKEYDLTAAEIDKFVAWYDAKSDGVGKSYFTLPKRSNVKPFIGRKEYIKYENIESFEIKDYNE